MKNNSKHSSSLHNIAKSIAKFQSSGTDAKQLLALSYPSLEKRVKHGSPASPIPVKKNHQKHYRQTLREIQKNNQINAQKNEARLEEEKKRRLIRKQKQFGDVQSKVFQSYNISDPISPRSCASSCTISTFSQGSYESRKNDDKHDGFPFTSIQVKTDMHQPRFIASGRPDDQSLKSKASLVRKHKSYGKIPPYILKRKDELQKQENELIEDELSNLDGSAQSTTKSKMIRMSELERVETLSLLKKNEKRVRSELLRLPLAAQGQGTIKKREKLEIKLNEIEDAKKIFSNDKVYVVHDDE